MDRALVLNASYEPLCVVPLRRAVVLVLAEKAEVVAEGDGSVRSPSRCLPMPAVIRLTRFVRVPFRRGTTLTRPAVLARDRYRCAYCNQRGTTVDHVIPRSRGGRHRWDNVVAACRTCNGRKDDRTPQEAGMTLLWDPYVPAGTVALVVAVGRIDESWEPYLAVA